MNLWQDEKPPGRPAWATGGSRSINSTGAEHSSGKARALERSPDRCRRDHGRNPLSACRFPRVAPRGLPLRDRDTFSNESRQQLGARECRDRRPRDRLHNETSFGANASAAGWLIADSFQNFLITRSASGRARNPNAGFTENRLTRIRRSRWTPGRRPCSRQVAKGIPICHSRSRRLYAGWLRSGWLQHIIAAKESPTRSLGRKKTTAEEGGLSSGP